MEGGEYTNKVRWVYVGTARVDDNVLCALTNLGKLEAGRLPKQTMTKTILHKCRALAWK